jgi:hypothetical protein
MSKLTKYRGLRLHREFIQICQRAFARAFPVHPLTITLIVFLFIIFGPAVIEYDAQLLPVIYAPSVIKLYSGFITIAAVCYAFFAALKTAENLFFDSKPRESDASRFLGKILSQEPLTPAQTVWTALVSYLLTIYAFALVYVSLNASNPSRFHGLTDLISSVYFSVVTIATVGYGDIIAQGRIARAFVTSEILVGVAYQVFFFSVIAGLIRRGPERLNTDT